MGDFRTIYRGYVVFIFSEFASWAFRAEPTSPDLPILGNPLQEGHASWGKALETAEGEIDRLLSG
jgi:hypothetical protein